MRVDPVIVSLSLEVVEHREVLDSTRGRALWRHHYVQKKLGSVAYIYGRAQEFVWYHFQMIVKRSLHQECAAGRQRFTRLLC